ncbi:MAG: type II secretion system F family protein [Candidatus Binatia bacterium]
MGQFQYRATDAEGKIVEGTIEAAEVASVVARLHDRGLMPIKIGPVAPAKAKGARLSLPALPAVGGRRPPARLLLSTTQNLAVLLGGGLPLDRSLATLVELADHTELKRIISEVLHEVQGGKSLAEAMSQHAFFPPLYVNMVRAGEMGGFLEPALSRLAEYLERGQQLRDEVRAALTYPALLTVAMGGSILILLVYVLPKFEVLFGEMGRALPPSAAFIMAVSRLIRGYWWAGVLLLAVAVLGFRSYVGSPRGRFGWDAFKLRMIGIGPVIRKMEVASLTRTLGTLLKSGVPMLQALGTVKEIARNQVIVRAIAEVEVGAREGAGVAEPLARSGVFPTLAVQMISVGEETGRLDEMLIRIADHFDRDVRITIAQFTRLLEPVMLVVMGVAVGFVVMSMLSAIFSVNDLPT